MKFFGAKAGIDRFLNYSLQLERLSREQFAAPQPDDLPGHVRSYIARFDAGLTEDELNSDRFAYRVLFVPRLVGKPGQAEEVVEFVKTNAAITDAANREYVHFKEVERTKYLPSRIVKMMKEEGYRRFTMQDHTDLWRAHCAKDPAQGYGVAVERSWYWYQSWVDLVRKHCSDNVANLQ